MIWLSMVLVYLLVLAVYRLVGEADHWLVHNIIMAPLVLIIRVPLMSVAFVLVWIGEFITDLANDYGRFLPAFRRKTDPKGWKW